MEEESQNSVADSQTFDQSQPIDAVKKKRGRPPRVHAPPVKMIKEEDEDVCFICFDGGSLVLCDRRGCPKAYHPACVKRDEAFFQSKAKWTCGWHICSICQKAAHHMCYTCTYSLCKGCIKKTDYVCVRGDKGFCTVCLKTIMLIENDGQGKDEKAQVDFDDKTSWEYLFKVYWVYLKGKLSLTLDELTQAKNPSKGPETTLSVSPSTCVHNVDNDLKSIKTDTPPQVLEASETKRRKKDEQMVIPHKETVSMKKLVTKESSSVVVRKDWATKELLDFVAHMKNGDTSVISQFDVQELMLEYIKRNNLRDPKKKSQILCDSRLKILFGKPRVGHFEMLKLLEFHFFMQEDLSKNKISSIAKQVDPDWNSDNIVTMSSKKRKNHKKVEERTPQNKLDEYAAIDIHNINLVYLRRKVMENLIGDSEEFNKKVVGAIVRIRITSKDQKHDIYRLVRVVGTSKADAPYKVGGKSADVMLEVLNLDKKETVSIDAISNQDLSEDECRRLRQSIKCGLVKRFTVGEIQDKAVSLQYARLNDILEAETLRLNNLRDRASEKGHKKSLREYVEKLQLLKTPEERERRMREIPDVHSDPKMNPDYETDDGEEYSKKEDEQTKPKFDSRKNTSTPKKPAEFSNNVSSRSWKNEKNKQLTIKSEEDRMTTRKDAHGIKNNSGRPQNQVEFNGSTITNWNHRTTGSSSFPNTASETATTSSMRNTPISNVSEIDKVWYYRDPSGKVQGPFCMVQLQKWSTTGYFPTDMRIWINREDESLLLTDVLKEQLQKKTATEKVGIRIEGLTVRTTNLLSDGQSSSGQSSVPNWITSSFAKSNESTGQLKMKEMASPTPIENSADNKPVSSVFAGNASLDDLPSPTPNKMTPEGEKVENTLKEQSLPSSEVREAENSDIGRAHLPKSSSEILVPEAGNTAGWSNGLSHDVGGAQLPKPASEDMVRESGNPSSCNNDSSRDVGGSQLPKTAEEWSGYSPTQVKQGERHPGLSQDIGGAQLPKQSSEILVKDSGNDGSWNNGSRQDVGGAHVPKSSSETLVQEAGNETGWNNNSRQDVGGAQLSETADEWSGYSPTRVKKHEWHPEDDHVATTTTDTEQTISSAPPSSQPEYNNYMPPWQGVRETIEFSTLAEESVSDLLAEVDAMESQNGFPSPTSRRNNFAEDIFNGSFEEFSPTPVHGARSNGFSSNGIDIQLPFKWPEIARENITKDIQVTTHSSEVQPPSQDMIDVNNSIKSVEGESQTKVGNVQIEEESVSMRPDHDASETSQDREGCLNEQKESECTQPASTKSEDPSSGKVRVDYSDMMTDNVTLQSAKVDAVGPPPPSISLTIGSDQVYPQQGTLNNFAQPAPEFTTRANTQLNPSQGMTFGWDPHQRYNNNSLRERGYSVEDSGYSRNGKPWVRQSLFGSGSGVINGGVSYSRPPPKGQRVCKFYESGRCKRGASCNYWHP